MRDRQVQSLLPHGILANRQEVSGLSRANKGIPQGTDLQGLSSERNEVVHKRCTKVRAWLATFALCVAFWIVFLGSLFASGAFAKCRTQACWKRVHAHRAQHWCLAHSRCVWKHRWHAEEAGWKNWLRSTANCESGNRAHIATGNGYFGLVQFDLSTWREAGGYGYPHQATWYEQAVRAIELAKRVGTGRWPVCGR